MNYGNPYQQYPYNNYGYPTYGRQNYMQPQQQMAQPQMQQAQQHPPMQYETPIQDIRFVTSKEAEAFIVMPNSKALLIDKNGGVAHLKTADNMGQSVTQYFKFEQVNADGTPLKPQEKTKQFDLSGFAKKEELNGFVTIAQYNDLVQQLETMKKIVASVNSPKSIEMTQGKGNTQPSK